MKSWTSCKVNVLWIIDTPWLSFWNEGGIFCLSIHWYYFHFKIQNRLIMPTKQYTILRRYYYSGVIHTLSSTIMQWVPMDKPWREISGSLRVYLILSCQHLLSDSFSVFQRRIKGLYILITRNWGSLYNVNATILKVYLLLNET